MRPLVLLITILALTLGGSALAADDIQEPRELGNSVTCSVTLRGAGCFVERPLLVLGAFEVAIGFDARAVWAGSERSYAAPYAILGWYEREWAAWVEVWIPDVGVPPLGKPDPIRAGFTVRF
jgi:hypothetical protein